MKLQLFTFLLIAVFAIFIAAAPTAEPTEVCGCQNSCTISCVPTKGACNCPAYCDPKYSCITKRTMIVERVAEPEVSGVPCGCTNDCILGCKTAGCICPQYCDPKYLCSGIVAVPTALPVSERQVPCGCTNACKINCPTCICPQYCDPAYECKSTS